MKSAKPPIDIDAAPEPLTEEFVPRLVETPATLAAGRAAARNLALGVALLLLAALLGSAAFLLEGPRALLWPAACLLTAAAVWALAQARVFSQKNGALLAAALACLVGVAVPLVERAFVVIQRERGNRLLPAPAVSASDVAPPPLAVPATPVPAPLAVARLSEIEGFTPPDPATTATAKVMQDTTVAVGRKPYLLQTGEVFALEFSDETSATVVAQGLRATLPREAVTIAPASGAAAAVAAPNPEGDAPAMSEEARGKIEQRARVEALKHYPAIGVKDSPENKIFVEKYEEFKDAESSLLDDPEWPLILAEILAEKHGWPRK